MDFNKYIIGGRLASDPELKSTPAGKMVCTFKVAVSKKEKQHFQTCVAWESTAQLVAKYFKKGSVIGVEGPIWTRSWTDQNGQKRYASELEVKEIHFPMREPGEGQNAGQGGSAPSPASVPRTSVYGNPGTYSAPASYVPDAYRTPPPAAPAPQQPPRGWENTWKSPNAEQLGMEVPPEMAPVPGEDDLPF